MQRLVTSIIFFSFFMNISNAQETNQSILENLTPAQIEAAKGSLPESFFSGEVDEDDEDNNKKQSLKKRDVDELSIISPYKFGYNFINSAPTSIVASSDLPFPNDYQISIGDIIGVVMSGSKNLMIDLQVQLDGTISFPQLGTISVVNKTFKEVKSELKNLANQLYIGVEIDLSLKDLSAKKITIVGTVNNPGTYLVNPFTTISNALSYSGGVSEIGSLRTIRLIRNNGDTFEFDLYDLLINGDRSKDLTIQSGDVIIVKAITKTIEISGMVKRPGLYEILPNENVADLLNFSLGFTGGANTENITITYLNTENLAINTQITNILDFNLDNVLSIDVFPFQNDLQLDIQVSGAILKPGYYKLEDHKTLAELIQKLDFVDVYPWLAVLEQFDEDNLIKSSTIFSLKDPSTYDSIDLLPNSKVYFANMFTRTFPVGYLTKQKIDDYALRLNHKQGSFNLPVIGRFKLESFINILGLDMSDVDDVVTYVSPLDSIVIQDSYQNMEFEAKKYNTISFRSQINDLIKVSILGQVDYPGTYTLKSGTTLEDLYSLIGEFKREAFYDGIIFTRESVRERQVKAIEKSKSDLNEALLLSIQKGQNIGDVNVIRALTQTIEPENLGRIAGDFKPKSSSSIKTVLFDGDKIIVPKNPNVINVFGEVLNPIAFEYEKRMTVKEAISNAGGYKDFAKKDSVYVIKANGLIEKANRNIFVKGIGELQPGDTIVVPRRIISINPGIQSLVPITQILSDFAFSAAAIESLSKN